MIQHGHRPGVERLADRIEKERVAALAIITDRLDGLVDEGELEADPRRHGYYGSDGRRGAVDEEGEFLATEAHRVRDRADGIAHDERVAVVLRGRPLR